MNRRELLARLGAAGLTGGLSWGLGAPARAARAATCPLEGPTIPAIKGPFAPSEIHSTQLGRANPGVRRIAIENDMDLAAISGAAPAAGQIVQIRGQLVTADCAPLAGASVALWQADSQGRYNHENERVQIQPADLDPGFGYWGRVQTDAEGRFAVRTVVPGAYPAGPGWWRPPHLHWTLRADGLPEVTTQSYFDGDALMEIAKIRQLNNDDLILNLRGDYAEAHAGALERARQRVLEELVVGFAPGDDGALVGEIVFRLG